MVNHPPPPSINPVACWHWQMTAEWNTQAVPCSIAQQAGHWLEWWTLVTHGKSCPAFPQNPPPTAHIVSDLDCRVNTIRRHQLSGGAPRENHFRHVRRGRQEYRQRPRYIRLCSGCRRGRHESEWRTRRGGGWCMPEVLKRLWPRSLSEWYTNCAGPGYLLILLSIHARIRNNLCSPSDFGSWYWFGLFWQCFTWDLLLESDEWCTLPKHSWESSKLQVATVSARIISTDYMFHSYCNLAHLCNSMISTGCLTSLNGNLPIHRLQCWCICSLPWI